MNESELIQAARGGDEAAFEQLVRLHEKKIYNLCLRMCGSSEDAAEAAQDTAADGDGSTVITEVYITERTVCDVQRTIVVPVARVL